MKKLFKAGISIRVIHVLVLVCVVAIVALLVFSTRQSSDVFSTLSSETDNYIVRQKAAHDLMEASDYLTENVQRFAQTGDEIYLDRYFEEAEVSRRRESAINAMNESQADANLVRQLEEALTGSKNLMHDEYLAMEIVIEEMNLDTKYNEKLEPYKQDAASVSANDGMEAAQELVMGNGYYEKKEEIRTDLKNALEMLDNEMSAARRKTSAELTKDLTVTRILIVVLVLVLLILVVVLATQCTIPLITAYRCNEQKRHIPNIGSREFRALSASYNEMHDRLQIQPDSDIPDEGKQPEEK